MRCPAIQNMTKITFINKDHTMHETQHSVKQHAHLCTAAYQLLVIERLSIIFSIKLHAVEPYLSRDVLDCLVDDDPGRHKRIFKFKIRNECNLVFAAVATEGKRCSESWQTLVDV
jgi:hypothetical protein